MADLKQYLYRIQPTRLAMLIDGATAEESTLLSAHYQYLKGLTEQGVVLLAGPTLVTDESNFGIIVFEAESDDAAHELMNNDPAVKNGVMRATLFPFRVSLMAGR
jgi:uncharacterized protein YciI